MKFNIDNIDFHIGNAIPVPSLAAANYVPKNNPFKIKNDGADTVSLEVMFVNGSEYIATNFAPGWNVEVVKAIKQNATAGLNLKRSI